jgi:hypothetical protein
MTTQEEKEKCVRSFLDVLWDNAWQSKYERTCRAYSSCAGGGADVASFKSVAATHLHTLVLTLVAQGVESDPVSYSNVFDWLLERMERGQTWVGALGTDDCMVSGETRVGALGADDVTWASVTSLLQDADVETRRVAMWYFLCALEHSVDRAVAAAESRISQLLGPDEAVHPETLYAVLHSKKTGAWLTTPDPELRQENHYATACFCHSCLVEMHSQAASSKKKAIGTTQRQNSVRTSSLSLQDHVGANILARSSSKQWLKNDKNPATESTMIRALSQRLTAWTVTSGKPLLQAVVDAGSDKERLEESYRNVAKSLAAFRESKSGPGVPFVSYKRSLLQIPDDVSSPQQQSQLRPPKRRRAKQSPPDSTTPPTPITTPTPLPLESKNLEDLKILSIEHEKKMLYVCPKSEPAEGLLAVLTSAPHFLTLRNALAFLGPDRQPVPGPIFKSQQALVDALSLGSVGAGSVVPAPTTLPSEDVPSSMAKLYTHARHVALTSQVLTSGRTPPLTYAPSPVGFGSNSVVWRAKRQSEGNVPKVVRISKSHDKGTALHTSWERATDEVELAVKLGVAGIGVPVHAALALVESATSRCSSTIMWMNTMEMSLAQLLQLQSDKFAKSVDLHDLRGDALVKRTVEVVRELSIYKYAHLDIRLDQVMLNFTRDASGAILGVKDLFLIDFDARFTRKTSSPEVAFEMTALLFLAQARLFFQNAVMGSLLTTPLRNAIFEQVDKPNKDPLRNAIFKQVDKPDEDPLHDEDEPAFDWVHLMILHHFFDLVVKEPDGKREIASTKPRNTARSKEQVEFGARLKSQLDHECAMAGVPSNYLQKWNGRLVLTALRALLRQF